MKFQSLKSSTEKWLRDTLYVDAHMYVTLKPLKPCKESKLGYFEELNVFAGGISQTHLQRYMYQTLDIYP